MKAKLTIFAAFLLFGGILAAQSSVEIKDLIFQPINNSDSTSTDIKFEVMLKMSNPASAEHIVLQFGTVQDSGDIISFQADIVEDEGQYYALFALEQELITGYETKVYIGLTQTQFVAFATLTVYVEDINGQLSNKLYFVKQ